jgi:hypothetical protein
MAAFMPAWRPLDATHSVRLLSERPRGGRVVALCVAPGLAGRPEGARLAVGLARRWTEGGLSVVLADGDLARPILHLTVGLANVKGLADLLLVGDPWQALVLSTAVPGLKLIPAGGGAAPTSSQAARDRLADLCREVPSDGSALVMYVPLGTMLAEWAVDLCTDIVVLSGEGEAVASLFAEDEDRIRAHVGPTHAQHRPLESAQPARVAEPASEQRSASAATEEAPPTADHGPREHPAEARPGRSSPSRIEDRWAEAAALLRARREGTAPAAEPASEPRAAAEPPAGKASSPAPEPEQAPAPTHSEKLVFRSGTPKRPEPSTAEDAPLPLWSPEPRRAASPPRPAELARPSHQAADPSRPAKAAARPPLPPRPRKDEPKAALTPPLPPQPPREKEPQDPLATPPIMMAEWDRFGDEEEEAHRSAQRRKIAIRVLAGLGGVAVVAGAVWIWTSTRSMPPYEARSTTLPRASIPPAGAPAPGAALASATDTATPDTALAGDSSQVTDTAGAPPGTAVPETRAPHQRYSWSMAAMGTMDGARSLVERLRRRAPDQAFIIAPIVSDGRSLYRVLGGLAADRDELARIREPLGQATGQPAGTWLVREAPLAFSLQDFDDAESATSWIAELGRSGVPAYVLVVERDDGSLVHRVYAGAYANEAEAAAMRSLIDSAGIRGALLVERKGRAGG